MTTPIEITKISTEVESYAGVRVRVHLNDDFKTKV